MPAHADFGPVFVAKARVYAKSANVWKAAPGDVGCLPFTQIFRKIRLESKSNTTFWVVLEENFQEQRNT